MKNPDPGYLLPTGEAYTDDFACQLIYIPRKDEYFRAMLGAILYMGTWVAWERDDDKRGKDAAQAWREANELTMECWRMACLEEVTDELEAIRLLLESKKDCCDDSLTFGIQPSVDTDIVPDVGDPPDFYGITAIADWEDWKEHVCYNAHLYVDNLVNAAEEFHNAAELSLWSIGLVGALLAILSFTGIGLPIAFGLASAVLIALAAATSLAFDDAGVALEATRDNIVCALILGNNLSDVVEAAIGGASAEWLLAFSHVDYESATAIIYEGGFGTEYLPTETRDDCVCAAPTGVYVNAVGGINVPWYSLDSGSTWLPMIDHEIAYGVEYWIAGPDGVQNVGVAFVDVADDPVDVVVTDMDVNYAPGNGLFWNAEKADTTVIDLNVLRTTPGDYPFSYPQVHWWSAAQNFIGKDSGYHLSCTFSLYT